MAKLNVGNECRRAVEPYLDAWAQRMPRGGVLAFKQGNVMKVRITKSFEAAAAAQDELPLTERRGSIILELTDHVLML